MEGNSRRSQYNEGNYVLLPYIIVITGNVTCYNSECNSDNNCNGISTNIGTVMPRLLMEMRILHEQRMAKIA